MCPTRRLRAPPTIGYPLLVKAVAGGGGKGMRTVVDARGSGARRARRAVGSGHRVRRRRGVPRAAAFAAAARRSAAARRISTAPCFPFVERECSIQRRHQKVVEETPVAGGDAGDPASDDGRRGVGRARGRLHQRRHDRVPPRRGRPLLLPGDEHAAAGRAPDHRDGDRRRSGPLADSHRARRAARARSGAAADPERPRDRVPHLRRGSRQQFSALAGPDLSSCERRPGRASATTAASPAGSRCRSSTIR